MPKKTPKEGMRRFIATVHEEFSGAYEIEAKDEDDARRIVEEGIDGDDQDYCPSQEGSGYRRKIYLDPD